MLVSYYTNTRQRTENLCRPLTVEDYVPQVVEFASPPKWHLAHTSWFFEEMILKQYGGTYKPFDADYNTLFNSYYQTSGLPYARHQRGVITRPSVAEIYEYRAYVDKHMLQLLSGEVWSDCANLVELGCQHEQQHQELLISDLKLLFAYNPKDPIYDTQFNEGFSQELNDSQWLYFPEGETEVGFAGDGFCFDNELGRHKTALPTFSISSELVSNAEYIEFIESDGYRNFRFWFDDAWAWVTKNNIKHPLYWRKEDSGWSHFTLAGRQALNSNAAVTHISYYEASAYAAWKGYRLPTEHEWEHAADQINWGQRWEWTSSAYHPYPGFEISDGAVGEYNGKFMVNQLVLRGASTVTAAGHSRKTYRNFFHPHHQWQYAGIRLAK